MVLAILGVLLIWVDSAMAHITNKKKIEGLVFA
jgi:hypothetical protein